MLLYYYRCRHVAKVVVVVESRKTVSLALQLIVLQKNALSLPPARYSFPLVVIVVSIYYKK